MDQEPHNAEGSASPLLSAEALLSTPASKLTTSLLKSSLDSLPAPTRVVATANLVLSGKLYAQPVLRNTVEIGLAAGQEETFLLEEDVQSRLEHVEKNGSGWRGWPQVDVQKQLEAALGGDDIRKAVVRSATVLQQARRRLDTYSTFASECVYHSTSDSHGDPGDLNQGAVVEMVIDDPWNLDETDDMPSILDDPWAEAESQSESVGAAVSVTQTSLNATSTTGSPIDLSTFVLQPLPVSALTMAASASLHALRITCERHAEELWPYRQAIIEAIPGWVSPRDDDMMGLIPAVGEDEVECDWPRHKANISLTLFDYIAPQYGISSLYPTPGELLPPTLDAKMTGKAVAEWYIDQVLSLDDLGLLDVQLSWVQHGAALGVPNLDAIGEDLSLLSRLIYDANLSPEQLNKWSVTAWRESAESDVVKAYLSSSTVDSIVNDIKRLVLPYIYMLESRAERAGNVDPDLVNRMLYGTILDLPLHLTLPCFEASKATIPNAKRLLKDDQIVARLALACLYGSDEKNAWTVMSSIFECLPVWDVSGADPESDREATITTLDSIASFIRPTTSGSTHSPRDLFLFFKPLPFSSLSRALDILDVHLESGEILARWDVAVYLRTLLQSSRNHDDQITLAERMVRRLGVVAGDDRRWVALWEDMVRLQRGNDTLLSGALGMLSTTEMMNIFLGGLLGAGNFSVAKKVIRRLEPEGFFTAKDLEDVVLRTSREFYMRAEDGNLHTGDMKLAFDCLSVAPESPAIHAERDFIQATSRLHTFKSLSSLTPAEIRHSSNKLDLIRKVLSTSDDAYRHPELIVELADKLGVHNDDVSRVEVLGMLCDSAMAAEDWRSAHERVQEMIKLGQPAAWDTIDPEDPWGNDSDDWKAANDKDEAWGDSWGEENDGWAEEPAPKQTTSADTTLIPKVAKDDGSSAEKIRDVIWRSCLNLGKQGQYDDVRGRQDLLGQALLYCPADQVEHILPLWRSLEQKLAQKPDLLRHPIEGKPVLSSGHTGAIPLAEERVLGSRTAARAARMALDIGATLNLRNLSASPALTSPETRSSDLSRWDSRGSNDKNTAALFDFDRPSSTRPMSSQGHHASPHRIGENDEGVRAGAKRALVKGVGWLLGAEEGEFQ